MRQQTCLLVVVLLVTAVVAQAQQARQGHRIGVLLYDGAPQDSTTPSGKDSESWSTSKGKPSPSSGGMPRER